VISGFTEGSIFDDCFEVKAKVAFG